MIFVARKWNKERKEKRKKIGVFGVENADQNKIQGKN